MTRQCFGIIEGELGTHRCCFAGMSIAPRKDIGRKGIVGGERIGGASRCLAGVFCFSERSLKSRAAVGWLLGDRCHGGLLDKEGRKGRSEQQGARRQGGWSSSRRFPSAGMCEQGARDDDERGRFSRQGTEIRHCVVVVGRHSMSAAGVSDRKN